MDRSGEGFVQFYAFSNKYIVESYVLKACSPSLINASSELKKKLPLTQLNRFYRNLSTEIKEWKCSRYELKSHNQFDSQTRSPSSYQNSTFWGVAPRLHLLCNVSMLPTTPQTMTMLTRDNFWRVMEWHNKSITDCHWGSEDDGKWAAKATYVQCFDRRWIAVKPFHKWNHWRVNSWRFLNR